VGNFAFRPVMDNQGVESASRQVHLRGHCATP
jgi:hypothetical protein